MAVAVSMAWAGTGVQRGRSGRVAAFGGVPGRLVRVPGPVGGCPVRAGRGGVVRRRAGDLAAPAVAAAGVGPGHGSVYAALAEGRIDAGGLRDLLVAYRLAGWPLVFAVDGTSWPRCDAETSPQRGYYYHPSRHSAGKPIVAGWWYQQVSQLNFGKDSWTWPVDCRRIRPLEDHVAATAGQVRDLLGRLVVTAAVPLFVFDGGYDPIALADELAGENAQLLVRIKGDRVFYADPPSRAPGGKGRPRRHGTRFDCKKPVTWGPRLSSWPPAMTATARSQWPPGPGCTPSSRPAAAGPAGASRRLCAAG
jgi:DDE superfamily endonuclease